MKTVEFIFEPNQKVKTILGITGVVDDCSVSSDGAKRYYVFTGEKESTRWYPEKQLEAI